MKNEIARHAQNLIFLMIFSRRLIIIIGRVNAFLPKVNDRSKSGAHAKYNDTYNFNQWSPNLAGDATHNSPLRSRAAFGVHAEQFNGTIYPILYHRWALKLL